MIPAYRRMFWISYLLYKTLYPKPQEMLRSIRQIVKKLKLLTCNSKSYIHLYSTDTPSPEEPLLSDAITDLTPINNEFILIDYTPPYLIPSLTPPVSLHNNPGDGFMLINYKPPHLLPSLTHPSPVYDTPIDTDTVIDYTVRPFVRISPIAT